MTLRPGEALVWRWGHLNPVKVPRAAAALPGHGRQRALGVSAGLLQGDLEKGRGVVEGVKSSPDGLSEGTITWTIKAPLCDGWRPAAGRGTRDRVLPFVGRKELGED